MTDANRDHLFISYATEDHAFAEWLALKLTAEGYRVWCDRLQLLGGESYPRDIDAAIKNRTFRFLALLSGHSLQKPNPVKERTIALNLANQRKEPFVIPLNVSGLSATELDWMTSDLTFIPFKDAWADGLSQLIKALEKAGTPRGVTGGPSIVADYVAGRSARRFEPERLWTNIVDVTTMPTHLLRLTGVPGAINSQLSSWPRYNERHSAVSWAFEVPNGLTAIRAEPVDWTGRPPVGNTRLRSVVANLLRQYIECAAVAKGLALSQDGPHKQLHFTSDGTAARWLPYTWHDGSKGRLKVTGERKFWIGPDLRETTRYHLSPAFSPSLDTFGRPCYILRIRLFLTDVEGKPLPLRKAISRRKKICAGWWNDAWLARTLATLQFITGGEELKLGFTEACGLSISAVPRLLQSPEGIDEALATALEPDGDDTDLTADDDEEEQGSDE
jgi:hypothetical protein